MSLLSRSPSACYIDPFRKTASLLALYINNVRITLAPAANSVFFNRVPCFPVFVFFFPLLLVPRRHLKEWWSSFLAVAGRIGRAMLYCCMSIAYVSEVMDVCRRQ